MRTIEIVTPEGKTQILPYTEGNLKWAKKLFASGFLQSWEILE